MCISRNPGQKGPVEVKLSMCLDPGSIPAYKIVVSPAIGTYYPQLFHLSPPFRILGRALCKDLILSWYSNPPAGIMGNKEEIHLEHARDDAEPHLPATTGGIDVTAADSVSVPKGYFYSFYFLGSMAAVGMSLLGSVGGFALVAPILGFIDADIGPNKNIAWVPLIFPVGLAVGQTLVGRLSDIFGRRWFLAGGQGLGVVGAIICATAHSIPTIIAGSAIVGLAGSTALSFPFIIGELVPMKYRFIGNAYANTWCIPFSGLAPVVANSLVNRASWRWCYYLMIVFNGLSMILYILFYHPPTFEMKQSRSERIKLMRNFDYLGLFLFVAGVVCKYPLFLFNSLARYPFHR